MFGPESGAGGWAGLAFLYDRVRVKDHKRVADFLGIWEAERCKMVEMTCELHDKYAANTQFITHLMGRILSKQARFPYVQRGQAHYRMECLGGLLRPSSLTVIEEQKYDSIGICSSVRISSCASCRWPGSRCPCTSMHGG